MTSSGHAHLDSQRFRPRRPTSKKISGRFLVWKAQARGMTELIPTIKMETRHSVERSFGNEFPFPSIYRHNHRGVMAA